jgi:hypothetical protein
MATLTVMSWNIESLGDTKTSASPDVLRLWGEVVWLIARAVLRANAQLVGLMEIKSGRGKDLAAQLVEALNQLTQPAQDQGAWHARVSLRQDGAPQEEYIMLWRELPGALTLDAAAEPAPSWLVGVFDPAVLDAAVARRR